MKKFQFVKRNAFFDLPPECCDYSKAKVVIIPWGLEKTTSYRGGTSRGPKALLAASRQVEFFDEDLWRESFRDFGIATLMTDNPNDSTHASSIKKLESIASYASNDGKIPITIGGEHSLTLGPVRALARKYENLAVLHFDAHADLRPEFEGNPYSHASAIYMILPYVSRVLSLGVRSFSEEELPVLSGNRQKIKIYWWRRDLYPRRANLKKLGAEFVRFLGKRPVYVTFDVDCLNPAAIGSSTGTPVAGGLSFDQTLDIFERTLPKLNIVGADFVEHSPVAGLHAPDFAIAKLIYKFLGLAFSEK